jgi:hypothetical protein
MPVNLNQSARDLKDIARSVATHPTYGTKILHSRALHSARSAVTTKGSAGSKALGVLQAGVGLALKHIPVPVLGSLCALVWDKAADYFRTKSHEANLATAVSKEDKVKFELKEIGGQVAHWDRYRWKVWNAINEYNTMIDSVKKGMETQPCDTWVQVWSKYYYLTSRVKKLQASADAVTAVCDEVKEWLNAVEKSCSAAQKDIEALYEDDVKHLKTMQAHDSCSDTMCMFKKGAWESKKTVPTSEFSDFFVRAAAAASVTFGPHAGDLINEGASKG